MWGFLPAKVTDVYSVSSNERGKSDNNNKKKGASQEKMYLR